MRGKEVESKRQRNRVRGKQRDKKAKKQGASQRDSDVKKHTQRGWRGGSNETE